MALQIWGFILEVQKESIKTFNITSQPARQNTIFLLLILKYHIQLFYYQLFILRLHRFYFLLIQTLSKMKTKICVFDENPITFALEKTMV